MAKKAPAKKVKKAKITDSATLAQQRKAKELAAKQAFTGK